MKRIGFACHYVINDGLEKKEGYESFRKPYVMKSTTRSYLQRVEVEQGIIRLHECVTNNLNSIDYLISALSQLPEPVRMLRISSDLFPLYTAPEAAAVDYYGSQTFLELAEKALAGIGEKARANKIRLSFHPDQWVVLGSPLDYVVDSSLEFLEYHAFVVRMMGFAKVYGDFKCNIHLSGKLGIKAFLKNFYRLSPEARRIITVENTEFGLGTLDNCLRIRKHVPIVLDIHHHWIESKGEYIQPNDRRVQLIRNSWAVSDERPVMHFSWLKENTSYHLDDSVLPDYDSLRAKYNNMQLRQHALRFYNTAARDWALGFLDRFDIMCEAKAKNIASYELYNYALEKGYL